MLFTPSTAGMSQNMAYLANGWLYLGFGMGAIANSHILSLIIVTIMIAIFCFIRILRHQLTRKKLSITQSRCSSDFIVFYRSLTSDHCYPPIY